MRVVPADVDRWANKRSVLWGTNTYNNVYCTVLFRFAIGTYMWPEMCTSSQVHFAWPV